MEGVLWLDANKKRLAEISGHLTHEVKFGGGLLGHLDPGGTFHVTQQEVEPGYWELALLNVNMKGKALFFKTIAVQQKEVEPGYWELALLDVHMKGKALFFKTISVQEKLRRSMFRRLPDNLTVAQGADLLHQEIGTANARASNGGATAKPGSPSH